MDDIAEPIHTGLVFGTTLVAEFADCLNERWNAIDLCVGRHSFSWYVFLYTIPFQFYIYLYRLGGFRRVLRPNPNKPFILPNIPFVFAMLSRILAGT